MGAAASASRAREAIVKISFINDLSGQFGKRWPTNALRYAAQLAQVELNITRYRQGADGIHRVTCTIATDGDAGYDAFFGAIYGLDSGAKIKTAQAMFHDRQDFEAQRGQAGKGLSGLER